MKDKARLRSVVMWIAAMIICPMGIAFSARSAMGVSMIEGSVYVTYLKLSETMHSLTFGRTEYTMQAFVLLILCLAIRKFKLRYLLSFGTAVLFGCILDFWRLFIPEAECAMPERILCALLGLFITALAVACFFASDLPMQIWDLFVKELCSCYKLPTTRVKWIFDMSMLSIGIVLMLIFFHGFKWNAIGIGTICTAVLNAPLIGMWTKLLNRIWPVPAKAES